MKEGHQTKEGRTTNEAAPWFEASSGLEASTGWALVSGQDECQVTITMSGQGLGWSGS